MIEGDLEYGKAERNQEPPSFANFAARVGGKPSKRRAFSSFVNAAS